MNFHQKNINKNNLFKTIFIVKWNQLKYLENYNSEKYSKVSDRSIRYLLVLISHF